MTAPNFEVLRSLRNVTTLFDRGDVNSVYLIACTSDGPLIQSFHITDADVPLINTALDTFKTKLIAGIIAKHQQQGIVSPIMPVKELPQ